MQFPQRLVVVAVALGVVLSAFSTGAVAGKAEIRSIQRFPFKGGLEVASSGDFVYASQWNGHLGRLEYPDRGGVHIFDVSGNRARKAGFLHCPGYDNDVAVVEPGLIALGYGANACATDPQKPGVLFADVSDPGHPKVISDVPVTYAHTISVHPTEPLVYASTGGWLPVGNNGQVDIVDVSDPRRPKIVGNFTYPGYGCHDISFHVRKNRQIAFCPNASPSQLILDVSDPRSPSVLSAIANPLIEYGHTALASPDGNVLAITDEAFVAQECASGSAAIGGLWLYDISDPTAPRPIGYRSPRPGPAPVATITDPMTSYCTAAMIDWIDDSDRLIATWYSGGTELLDLRDPAAPSVVDTYRPDDALAYGVDFHRGRVYLNDINRGLEVLELDSVKG